MGLSNIIRISAKNCICKKGTSIQIVISLTISFILYICVFGYIDMLHNKLNDTTQTYSSSNYLSVDCEEYEEADEIIKHITGKFDIKDIKVANMPFLTENFCNFTEEKRIISSLIASVLEVDNKEYKFSQSIGQLYDLNILILIEQFDKQYSMITEYDMTEYCMINNKDTPLLYGSMPGDDKEILFPECYAEAYNISAEELVGKNITIKLIGENNEIVLLDNFKVSGILCNDYSVLSGHGYSSIMMYESFNKSDSVSIQFYPTDFSEISKICDELKEKYSIDAEPPNSFAMYEYLSKQIVFADKVMVITASLIIASMLLNVLRIIIYSFKKRLKYLGMLRALGMRDNSILLIILFETVIETIISALLAIVFSSVLMKYIFSYIAGITGVSADYNILSALIITRIVMFSLFFWIIISLAILFILKRNSVTELLRR